VTDDAAGFLALLAAAGLPVVSAAAGAAATLLPVVDVEGR
jgi:hypothetical protein